VAEHLKSQAQTSDHISKNMDLPGSIWRWLSHIGLCTSIFALAFVAVDRAHMLLMFALIVYGSICWFLCWRLSGFSVKTILLYSVLFRLALFGLPPSLSDDAYRYVWDGLIQHEGGNPYEFSPEDVPFDDLQEDLMYERLNSKSFISVYPPVSQIIFRLGTEWHEPNSLLSYYLIKGIFILAEMLAVFLLARIVSSGFVLFYAWNPVVIMETAGQAHTESAVLLALVLVIYLTKKSHVRWASVFLSVAGWIKLYPFIFFPFLWRRFGWRSVWPGIVALILLALPYAAPYVLTNVSASLDLYARYFEFNSGLYYSIKAGMQWLTGEDWSKQLGPFLRMIFLCGLPVLYATDKLQKWSLAQAMLITTGCYLVLTTTVHPWYLLIPLFLTASLQTHGWHWIWLSICSMGTYLLYADGPYWVFVIIGWAGWGILGIIHYAPKWMQSVMRLRAQLKLKKIWQFFPKINGPMTVLDLGCAEGYLGERIKNDLGASVQLADITSMNRTKLPHFLLHPGPLPWPSKHFDVVLLYFVLHHAEDAERLLSEAMRICRGRVIIVESIYHTSRQLKYLLILDRLFNRLRSSGKMNAQEKNLHFRTLQEWRSLFLKHKANLLAEFKSGIGPLSTAGFIIQANLPAQRQSTDE